MEIIEAGLYRARAEHAELGYTQTGKEQVIVRFRFVEAPHAGRLITYYGVITEKTEARVLRGIIHCGWDGASEDFSGITRNVVALDIEIEPDQQGNMRNRVRWIHDAKAALARKPLDDGQRAAFFDRVRGRVEEVKAELDARAPEGAERGDGAPF